MKLDNQKVLTDAVGEADFLLLGIGEEWGISFDEMLKEASFSADYAKLWNEELKEKFVPVLQREYLKKIHCEELKKAYDNLYQLVKDKNYFLLSMNKDRYPVISGFEKEKCVFPCGGYELFQCDFGCADELCEAAAMSDEIYGMLHGSNQIQDMQMPVCPQCKKEMVFNNVEAVRYVEKGYLSDWDRYMKWLQGTLNKKLCLLELGVSMRFPSVIRWPFEKTVYYNQKAKMFRIHHSLSQSMENISDRCYTQEENSVTYMSNLFVS